MERPPDGTPPRVILDEVPVVTSAQDSSITTTERDLARAFQAWDAAYRTNPDHFWSTVRHLVGSSTYEYGEACAAYLAHLLRGGDPLE